METKVVVYLKSGLRLAPTPHDKIEYVGSKVYCYFCDFGPRVKTLIGHIENYGNYEGELSIVTSGDGQTLIAKETAKLAK